MKLPNKNLERRLLANGYSLICGVDEVGMGCLAGPVVVCAVSLTKNFYIKNRVGLRGLRESKLLSAKQREVFALKLLKNKNLKFKICYAYPKTIDRLNIYQATRQAMKRAVLKITKGTFTVQKVPFVILVDGPHKIPGLNIDQQAIIKGDRNVFIIACASIIAKVYRDRMMIRYAKKYPGYGFEIHKGYGTKYHQEKLTKLGPCTIHRRSFAPVAKLVTIEAPWLK